MNKCVAEKLSTSKRNDLEPTTLNPQERLKYFYEQSPRSWLDRHQWPRVASSKNNSTVRTPQLSSSKHCPLSIQLKKKKKKKEGNNIRPKSDCMYCSPSPQHSIASRHVSVPTTMDIRASGGTTEVRNVAYYHTSVTPSHLTTNHTTRAEAKKSRFVMEALCIGLDRYLVY